jgi:hypothetical protein
VGRRHLSLTVTAGAALAVASPVGWHRLAADPPNDANVRTLTAYVAADSRSARAFSGELTYSDPSRLARVDFGRNLVVAVFDGPTCTPHLPSVASVSQNGRALALRLHGPPPDASSCHQRWPGGYELITVPKSGLARPYPTRAVAHYG